MVNYWIWVAKKDGIDRDILPDEIWTWNGCDIETSVGDKALIYKTKPDKHVKYLVEVTKDSWLNMDELPDEIFSCEFKMLYDFENPLSIDKMREESTLIKA